MKILMVLTSHDQLGDTDLKTGFWLEEFVVPYYALLDVGAKITLASPKGGQPPIDPKSNNPSIQTAAAKRFKGDPDALIALARTYKLSDMVAADFEAVMYPGGHGPLWDLTNNMDSICFIEAMVAAGKPIATVCHAPAVLLNARTLTGDFLVKGKKVTGFSNSEEATAQLTDVVPFLLEDKLIERGGEYSKADDWQPYALSDDKLITGQNPASSEAVANALLDLLG